MALLASAFVLALVGGVVPGPVAQAAVPVVDDRDVHDNLMAAFDSHFRVDRVDAPVHLAHAGHAGGAAVLAETGDGFACLTGLIMELKANWDLFTVQERAEMTAILEPWKADLMDPMWLSSGNGDDPAPPDEPCFGNYYDNVVEGEHFSVQWEDGAITESKANAFLDSLEFSYEREMEDLGWRDPSGINRYPMMVLVPDGNYAGAYTTVDSCQGQNIPYVVAYSGGLSQGNWYKIMACHELNHASQFSYGWAHEFWWWEATATYVEESVYPSYNDWANFVAGYSEWPFIGMNAWQGNDDDDDLFYHTYSMAIWGFYLDQYYGGLEAVQETWDLAYGRRNSTNGYDYWMPDVVEDMDLDFDEVWTGFMATNAVMAYAEQSSYREAKRTEDVDEVPSSGDEKDSLKPQSLGMAFVTFDDDVGSGDQSLKITLDAEDGPEWRAVLVRGDDEVEEMVVFELDDNGDGVATIPLNGSSAVHLVVSPMDDDAQGYQYRWTRADDWGFDWDAELVSGSGPDGEDTGEDDDDEDSDEDDSVWAARACSAGPAGVPLSAALLGLVVVARRRRES
jgi:hypothetical protein